MGLAAAQAQRTALRCDCVVSAPLSQPARTRSARGVLASPALRRSSEPPPQVPAQQVHVRAVERGCAPCFALRAPRARNTFRLPRRAPLLHCARRLTTVFAAHNSPFDFHTFALSVPTPAACSWMSTTKERRRRRSKR